MRKPNPIKIIVYFPTNESAKAALAEKVAEVHAYSVLNQIKHLSCSDNEKQRLVNALIADARARCNEEKCTTISALDMSDK